jgi:hypothetical protein
LSAGFGQGPNVRIRAQRRHRWCGMTKARECGTSDETAPLALSQIVKHAILNISVEEKKASKNKGKNVQNQKLHYFHPQMPPNLK